MECVVLLVLALAACAPAHDPDPRCRWPGFRCVIASPPQAAAVATPVLVDNPFFCPGPAPSPAPPAPRGEP